MLQRSLQLRRAAAHRSKGLARNRVWRYNDAPPSTNATFVGPGELYRDRFEFERV